VPWIAYAAKGEGVANVAMVPALLNIISNPSINIFGPPDPNWAGQLLESISDFDEGLILKIQREELVSAFESMCKELKGIRVAVYPTSDPKRYGQSAVVSILDLGDVEKHLAEWHNLVKALNRPEERAPEGETQRPPPCTYQRRAKNLGEKRVDLVTIDMPAATDGDHIMTDMLGPDWNKVRLAVVGKQVAVLVGSDLDLLKQTVANLEAGKKGLADEKFMSGTLTGVAAERTLEFHFSPGTRGWPSRGTETLPKPRGLTSLALTIQSDGVQVEIVPDKAAVKAFLGLADDSPGAETSRKPE
jgi:hypothetical protein